MGRNGAGKSAHIHLCILAGCVNHSGRTKSVGLDVARNGDSLEPVFTIKTYLSVFMGGARRPVALSYRQSGLGRGQRYPNVSTPGKHSQVLRRYSVFEV